MEKKNNDNELLGRSQTVMPITIYASLNIKCAKCGNIMKHDGILTKFQDVAFFSIKTSCRGVVNFELMRFPIIFGTVCPYCGKADFYSCEGLNKSKVVKKKKRRRNSRIWKESQ